jgi:hypothetical protein
MPASGFIRKVSTAGDRTSPPSRNGTLQARLAVLACPTCIPGWAVPQGSPIRTASRHQLFVFFESHRWCLYETRQASRLEEQSVEGLRKTMGGRCWGQPRVPDSSGDAARGTRNLGRRGSAKSRPTPVGRATWAHSTQSGGPRPGAAEPDARNLSLRCNPRL